MRQPAEESHRGMGGIRRGGDISSYLGPAASRVLADARGVSRGTNLERSLMRTAKLRVTVSDLSFIAGPSGWPLAIRSPAPYEHRSRVRSSIVDQHLGASGMAASSVEGQVKA